MFKGREKWLIGMFFPILVLGTAAFGAASVPRNSAQSGLTRKTTVMEERIRHQLVMLPFYGVFDNLSFSIEGSNTVVLTGQVTQPILKSDAQAAVKRVEGVQKVVNNIEVLPLSPFDNRIRWATYRAIFSRPGFEKYAIQAVSPIRIIVKNGNITLDGYVGNQMDKTLAYMAARSVPGAFSVTDNLQIG